MTGEQLRLGVEWPRRRAFTRNAFIDAPSNAVARALVEDWRNWPNRQAAISGPDGSGKTHLVQIWMAEAGAEKIAASQLHAGDAPGLVAVGAVAVDDADGIEAGGEASLFHLLNLARAEGAYVLLSGRRPPARWRIALPDLASRLGAFTHAAIEPPELDLIERLIAKEFADRHMRVPAEVAQFIAPRIEQSAAAALDAVTRLDAAVRDEKRTLTIRFVKETLAL